MSVDFIGKYYSNEVSYCDDIIDWFNNEPIKADGTVGNSVVDITVKDSLDVYSIDMPRRLYKRYLQEVFTALEQYKKEYLWCNKGQRNWTLDTMFNVQYYKPGAGFKKWHCENSGNNQHRHLAFMTYLNNVDNGGTEFYYQNYKSEAQKGLTLIWPVGWTHLHRGVISQTQHKYVATGWFIYE